MKVKKQAKRTVYNYAKGDFNSLRATLRCLPLLEIIDSEHDVDTAWAKWKGVFLTAVDSHIPKSTVKSSYRPPYVTQDIIDELNKKETLRKRANCSNAPQLWERFRELRRKIKRLLRLKKREYISKLASIVKEKPKDFWRSFKSKTTGSPLPDSMFLNDQQISSAEGKADAFNRYFASMFRPDIPNDHQLPSTTNTQNVLESISVSTEDVNSVLSTLSTDKATGPDEISARLLKECANEIAPSLTALFNKSLSLGKVPQEWKEANVTPIHKKEDIRDVRNYRPISLLSLVSKLLERVIHIHVSEFVHSSLNEQQHGFRKRRSCTTQLLGVFHDVGKALMDSGKEADLIYLDFSKAFDSVSHKKL